MNLPHSGDYTPDTGSSRSGNENEDLRSILQEMYTRQGRMEADMATTLAALQQAETARQQAERLRQEEEVRHKAEIAQLAESSRQNTVPFANRTEETSMSSLMRTLIETLTINSAPRSAGEATGPREWKPPSWDGRAETFRDYLSRMKSSFKVRSAMKPTLPEEYYWDTVYNTLPARERGRMRHFWEKGHSTKGKDTGAFFAQLEEVFADSNEQAKALEQLTHLRHVAGQPWHEHQLEFDGLLLSADGDSWNDATKIGYLKNTFSNAAKIYTAAMPKTTDYYAFSEEVERIMTNLEITDQFKVANKRWSKEKNKDTRPVMTVSAHSRGPAVVARMDADGDTIMAPTQALGDRRRLRGDRKPSSGKQRAKWVDSAERERRKERRLCFRCGGDGHRIRECPYAAAVRPTGINVGSVAPLLEDDDETEEPIHFESGKE